MRRAVVVGILLFASVASADDAADRREAARLAKRKRQLEVERDDAQKGTQPGRDDRVKAPIQSTQTKTDRFGKVTTINQGGPSNAGDLTDAAKARIQNNQRRFEEKRRELAQIDAQVDALRQRSPGVWESASKSDADEGGKLLAIPILIAIAPIAIAAVVPGTGQVSLNARFLGAGNRPGIDGLQGDGFLVSFRQERVIAKATESPAGVMTAFRIELGGFRDAGAIGSIGIDAGPGVRNRTRYLGATVGAHYVASQYQAAGWFPIQIHAGTVGPRWAIAMSGGFGWRRELANDGSAASMITTKGPAGTNSSTFRLAVMRRMIQVGFSIDDFDGNRIGSLNLGYGHRLLGSVRW